MKITILGANSYIARNLIYELRHGDRSNLNAELYLYDYQENQFDGEPGYASLSVLNLEALECVNFDVDIIYIFVGMTGTLQGFSDYDNYLNINEHALLNILTMYVKKESKAKLIFPSTRLVYKGKNGLLKEQDEKECKTIYAVNKLACEQYLQVYHRMYGISYVIFRICVPYGTMAADAKSYGTAEFMLSKARNGDDISIYGDGNIRRTIIHVYDLCNILIEGALSEQCCNDVFNIGGENYSLLEMAEKISKSYSVGVSHVEWPKEAFRIETGDTVFDDAKLKAILDYSYKKTFDQWIGERE